MKFAEFDNPDFIIMKEAIMAFEKILLVQSKEEFKKAGEDGAMNTISDEQKVYLFKMISVINSKFGT